MTVFGRRPRFLFSDVDGSAHQGLTVVWSRSRMPVAQCLQFGPQRLPVDPVDFALCGFFSREGVLHSGLARKRSRFSGDDRMARSVSRLNSAAP